MSCEICTIIAGPSAEDITVRIFEGGAWRVTLRLQDQEYLGTCFVTAKRHVPSLTELTPEEDLEFIDIRNRLIKAQMQQFDAKLVNVSCLMNNAFAPDGSGEGHVHYHFKPRYAAPVTFGGETFTDNQFGYYIRPTYSRPVTLVVGQAIATALRSNF